jgi:hypothetical protein
LRLPKVALSPGQAGGPPYSATIEAMIWPGVRERVNVRLLARRPESACCNRCERLPDGRLTYVVTLYNRGQPFASVYLDAGWLRS